MVDIGLQNMFSFNFIFALIGASIIGVSVYIKVAYDDYTVFLENHVTVVFYIVLAIGCVTLFISCLGCFGAIAENTCMLLSFSIILVIIFALQIAVGIVVIVKRKDLHKIVENGLNDTLYGIKSHNEFRKPWDLLQNEFECCGVHNASDWIAITEDPSRVPSSCCQKPEPSTCLIAEQKGCYDSLFDFLDTQVVTIAIIGFGVAIVQILGIAFSCCMFSVYRKKQQNFDRI